MEIKSIGVLSAGKINAAINALFGLIFGGIFSLVALAMPNAGGDGPEAILLGAGAVIILPIMAGISGFLGGILWAAIYNLIAGMVGGIELTVDLGEPDRSY
jgi:hypothetical protein